MTKQKLVNCLDCIDYKFEFSDAFSRRIFYAHTTSPSSSFESITAEIKSIIDVTMPKLLEYLPYYDDKEIAAIQEIAIRMRKKFDVVVVVGMGGALFNGLSFRDFIRDQSDFKVVFSYRLCKNQLDRLQSSLDLKRTGFIFISNSGDRVETLAIAEYWFDALRAAHYEDFHERFVFVSGTQPDSLLGSFYGKIGGIFLEYDSHMGGRFATFTTPHLLVSALSNIDLKELFFGGNRVLKSFLSGSEGTIKAMISGAIMTSFGLGSNNFSTNIINASYDSRFDGMLRWYGTTLAESLGKEGVKISPFVLDLPIDQHGLLQAILVDQSHQSINLFCIDEEANTKVKRIQSMLQDELYRQFDDYRIPLRKIILKDTKISSFGAIMMHLILETITAAVLIDVNPFTQPQIDNIKSNLAMTYRQQGMP